MITVVIQGGLGNQLFQYAYAKSKLDAGKEVQLDISFYSDRNGTKYTKRPLELFNFNIDTSIPTTTVHQGQTFLKKILCRIDPDRRVRFIPIDKNKDNYIADGYYTSEKYFSNIREVLLGELVLKEKSEAYKLFEQKILSAKKPLIIHARRGDYLTSTGFTILDKDYYQRALGQFDEDCELFGFSDDPVWLQGAIGRQITTVSGNGLKDYEELSLMSLGQNFIISNSTFSWWGAWLSQHRDKKVVAPKKWFTSSLWCRANKDTIPESWVRI